MPAQHLELTSPAALTPAQQGTARRCCALLRAAIAGHLPNALYAAQWLGPLAAQLHLQLGAAGVLREIMRDNRALLEGPRARSFRRAPTLSDGRAP